MKNISRRDFVKYSGIFASGVTMYSGCVFSNAAVAESKSTDVLKGFIVSDAHFGWVHENQPSAQRQRDAIAVIRARFPDLDVFIDTGDAHHSGLSGSNEIAAKQGWTDIIANGCGNIPFYYVMGNHEIIVDTGVDTEWSCSNFGSITCRPYYSFDIKNIHFISLPELLTPVFINKESIDWLKLDLELNKDKTTILLSHNSIKGTTTLLGEPGYRGISNSRQLLDIFSQYPNVISWMHGHNHTYEVVKQNDIMYVSNGRIGGFIPPAAWGVGQQELGGIYFEVHNDKFVVKCFSASSDKFHEELGFSTLTGVLNTSTSIDSSSKPAFSYGIGDMNDRQITPVFNHHTSKGQTELYAMAANSKAVNDDPGFTLFEYRDAGIHGKQWMLMGASVGYPAYFEPNNTLWTWEDPGIRLLAQANLKATTDICIPEHMHGRNVYYKCSPGKKYKTEITIDSPSGGQELCMLIEVRDSEGNFLTDLKGEKIIVEAGVHSYSSQFDVPHLPKTSNIYYDQSSDTTVQILAKAKVGNLHEQVVVDNFSLYHAQISEIENAKISIDDKSYQKGGKLSQGQVVKLGSPSIKDPRAVVKCDIGGDGKISWLIRQQDIDWQVRNATVADRGRYLEIASIRSRWTPDKQVMIVPVSSSDQPFVCKTELIDHCKIYPLNRGNDELQIEIVSFDSGAKFNVACKSSPVSVTGAADWVYANGNLQVNVDTAQMVKINWA